MALVQVKCPRCETRFEGSPRPDGSLLCPGCGARLARRPPPRPTAGRPGGPPPVPAPASPPPVAPAEIEAPPVSDEPAPTVELGSTPVVPPEPPAASDGPAPEPDPPPENAASPRISEDALADFSLQELMLSLHRTQQRMLEILERQFPAAAAAASGGAPPLSRHDDEVTALPPAPTRARRRKTVLLVDDDDETRQTARRALEEAEVPVRVAFSGEQALALFAEQKPDVLVLEGELGGEINGRELVDRIRATTEWLDVPIILYTRARLSSQDEARTTYSSDDYVLKGAQGPVALVSQVIATFRST